MTPQIRSMTGYGEASVELSGLRLKLELRSVNHRFADVRLRLPAELASREARLRRRVLGRIRRGRVDVVLRVDAGEAGRGRTRVDLALASDVLDAARTLRERFGVTGAPDVAALLAVPGVLCGAEASLSWGEAELGALEQALELGLRALDGERTREGAHLAREIAERLARMQSIAGALAARAAELPGALADRLRERLAQLAPELALDPSRVAQEVVLLAERADVTEETVRLAGHLERARALVDAPDGQPLGKRLEFLLQEIHRETNTINSKSPDLELSRRALELKVETEKVREQAQNLE